MTPRLGNLLTYEAHTGSWGQNWKYRIWVIIWEGCRDAKVKQIGKKEQTPRYKHIGMLKVRARYPEAWISYPSSIPLYKTKLSHVPLLNLLQW